MKLQCVAHAHDNADGLERRLASRPAHLEGVRAMKDRGEFVLGGALLSEDGTMIGSMMLVEFERREELDAWLLVEPYVTERVWEHIDVRPFRRANV